MYHCSLSLPQLKMQLHKDSIADIHQPSYERHIRQDMVIFLPVGDSQLSTLPLCCSSDPT